MASYAKSLLVKLQGIADVQNPDIARDYPVSDALTIWTEGGEWPAYSTEYDAYQPPKVTRDIDDIDYSYTSSIDDAVQYITSVLDQKSVVGITMDCGQGKSTRLVRAIHNLKYGKRTLVVQPSSLIAMELATYLNRSDVTYVNDYRSLTDNRGMHYMSAGVMLSLIAANKVFEDDVIIMDEAHSSTLVHSVVYEMLNRTTNFVVMMTASTTPDVKARKGVKLHVIPAAMEDITVATSQDSDALVIGVNSDSTYAFPASILTGLTIPDLNTVYDTGLRPDPRTQYGSVFTGERKASVAELTQSMGRLGRLTPSGTGYYVADARPLRKQFGISLYTVIASAISQTLGLTSCNNRLLTVNVWKHSGVLSPACKAKSHHSEVCSIGKRASGSIKLTAESLRSLNQCMSVQGSESQVDAMSHTRDWCDNVSKRSESVSPSSTTARVNYHVRETVTSPLFKLDKPSTIISNEEEKNTACAEPDVTTKVNAEVLVPDVGVPNRRCDSVQENHDECKSNKAPSNTRVSNDSVRTKSTASTSQQRNSTIRRSVKSLRDSEAVKTRASVRDANSKVAVHTISMSSSSSRASGSSIAQKRVESRLMARKPTSKVVIDLDIERQINLSNSSKSGCLTLTTGIKLPNSRECIINGDAAWARLFKKGANPVVPEGKIDSALVRSYWESIADSMYNYDSIFPSILPVVDPRQVTLKTIDSANKVISFDKLPSYSEQEILSVIALWNKYVVSLRGRCAAYDRLYNFIDYFDSVYGFGRATNP